MNTTYPLSTFLAPIAALFLLFIGCSTHEPIEINLEKVILPKNALEAYGETITHEVEGDLYNNESIQVEWNLHWSRMVLKLTNHREHPVRILFDGAAYTDYKGQSYNLVLLSRQDIDNGPQKSVTVPGDGFVRVVVGAGCDWSWTEDGWARVGRSLMPLVDTAGYPPRPVKKEGSSIVVGPKGGDAVQIDLPIEIEGVSNLYRFVFRVRETTEGQ